MVSPMMSFNEEMARPHSVAFGVSDLGARNFGASMYPLMNFQWQQSQQPPDVTNGASDQHNNVSGLLFRPDVISDQPCYANDPKDQPTYANDHEAEPNYLNTISADRIHRGASLPPQIKAIVRPIVIQISVDLKWFPNLVGLSSTIKLL